MRGALRYRPSPAMVIALIALFVSIGGVSYGLAGTNTVFSNDIVNDQVKTRDIKNNDVRARDIRTGAVRSSDVRNDALTGNDVNESTLGTVPSAGTAESPAYAHILAAGTVDSARSKGIANANVTNPSPGLYCLDNLDFTPKSVTGNVDSADGPGVVEVSTARTNFGTGGHCPATAQVEVITFEPHNSECFEVSVCIETFRNFRGGFYLIFN